MCLVKYCENAKRNAKMMEAMSNARHKINCVTIVSNNVKLKKQSLKNKRINEYGKC